MLAGARSLTLYLHVGGMGDIAHRHPVLHILGLGIPKCCHIVRKGLASQQALNLLCQEPTGDGACQSLGGKERPTQEGTRNQGNARLGTLPSFLSNAIIESLKWSCLRSILVMEMTPACFLPSLSTYDGPWSEARQHSGFPISCPPKGCWHKWVPQEGSRVYCGLLPPGLL